MAKDDVGVPTIRVLRLARKGVADPDRWCAWKLNYGSRSCALGHVTNACEALLGYPFPSGHVDLRKALDALSMRHGYRFFADANDCGGRLVALAILDDAIAELEVGE
jgi:hypothetical protein